MPGLGSLLAAHELESSLADYWQMKKEDLQARASGKKNIIDFSLQLLFIPLPPPDPPQPPSTYLRFELLDSFPWNIFGARLKRNAFNRGYKGTEGHVPIGSATDPDR